MMQDIAWMNPLIEYTVQVSEQDAPVGEPMRLEDRTVEWQCGCQLVAQRYLSIGEEIKLNSRDFPTCCPEHGATLADWVKKQFDPRNLKL